MSCWSLTQFCRIQTKLSFIVASNAVCRNSNRERTSQSHMQVVHWTRAGIAQSVKWLGYGLDYRDWIPARSRDFFYIRHRIQTSSWAHPASYRMGNVGRSVKLITNLHLLPSLRMLGAISPLPHTSSWRGTQLSTGTTLPLPSTLDKCERNYSTREREVFRIIWVVKEWRFTDHKPLKYIFSVNVLGF
jgi:hypothetical protein